MHKKRDRQVRDEDVDNVTKLKQTKQRDQGKR